MSRLFITSLGTSRYLECRYVIDGQASELVSFVQEALIDRFCHDWKEDDRILVFCTPKAEGKNWVDGKNFDKGLESRLRVKNLKASITKVSIPEGQNEDEIMRIFEIFVNHMEKDDKVLLDITHSLRSLPLLHAVVLNYAKVLKDIQVMGIYYGAFEVLGPPNQARKIPPERRQAPVFDLSPYDLLLDWARAVDVFRKTGRASEIKRLVGRKVGAVMKGKGEDRQTALDLKALADNLERLCTNILTSRCRLVEKTEGLGQRIDEIRSQQLIAPLTPLFDLIGKETRRFETDDPVKKGFEAARWCLQYGLVPQAYTFLRETVITGLCRGFNDDPWDEETRERLWKELIMGAAHPQGPRWDLIPDRRRDRAQKILKDYESELKALGKHFQSLANLRNDILHGGCRRESQNAQRLRDNLGPSLQKLESAWHNLQKATGKKIQREANSRGEVRRAFVVLSHQLLPTQRQELQEIWKAEEVILMPPNIAKLWSAVPPETTTIRDHLESVTKWIQDQAQPGDLVVIQGDAGATFFLVHFCMSIGMVALHATTRRILRERVEPDGRVIQERVFDHIAFREYEYWT